MANRVFGEAVVGRVVGRVELDEGLEPVLVYGLILTHFQLNSENKAIQKH